MWKQDSPGPGKQRAGFGLSEKKLAFIICSCTRFMPQSANLDTLSLRRHICPLVWEVLSSHPSAGPAQARINLGLRHGENRKVIMFLWISSNPSCPQLTSEAPVMSSPWESEAWEASTFDRGSQTSQVAEVNPSVTRRPEGGAIHPRLASALWTGGSLSGDLSHHSAVPLSPSVVGNDRMLPSVNGVKISSAKALNTPLLLSEPARLSTAHVQDSRKLTNSPRTALKEWPWQSSEPWMAVEATQGLL